jgi:hypothetical protein
MAHEQKLKAKMQKIQDLKRDQAKKMKMRQSNLMSKSPSRIDIICKIEGVSPIGKKN